MSSLFLIRILQVKTFIFIQYRVTLSLDENLFEVSLNADLQIFYITEATASYNYPDCLARLVKITPHAFACPNRDLLFSVNLTLFVFFFVPWVE